jgi:hypothetical protein
MMLLMLLAFVLILRCFGWVPHIVEFVVPPVEGDGECHTSDEVAAGDDDDVVHLVDTAVCRWTRTRQVDIVGRMRDSIVVIFGLCNGLGGILVLFVLFVFS